MSTLVIINVDGDANAPPCRVTAVHLIEACLDERLNLRAVEIACITRIPSRSDQYSLPHLRSGWICFDVKVAPQVTMTLRAVPSISSRSIEPSLTATPDPMRHQLYWTQKGPDNAGLGQIFRANIDIPDGDARQIASTSRCYSMACRSRFTLS